MNLPNFLTLLRIFLVPAFLIAVIYGQSSVALGLFLFAGLTDILDGYFARRLRLQSRLGVYLDPLADKLLITVSYVSLAVMGFLPPWLAVVVVARDLYISLGTGVVFFSGFKPHTLPSRWGKWTTFLQIATIACVLVLANFDLAGPGLDWLFFVTGAMTLFSGFHYILKGIMSLPQTSTED